METRSASRSAAVSEVLDGDNYLVWSVQLRNYLMVHDLWDIVKATNEPPKSENDEAAFKAWSRKNIMALHMIQISCGQRIYFVISLITSAKIAWDTLEEICRIPKNVYEGISLFLSNILWLNTYAVTSKMGSPISLKWRLKYLFLLFQNNSCCLLLNLFRTCYFVNVSLLFCWLYSEVLEVWYPSFYR